MARQDHIRRILAHGKVIMRPRDGSQPTSEEFVDLSMGGTFIKTMFPEEIGTVFDLEFDLFYGKVRTVAEVCWTRGYEKGPDEPYGMGLKFLDLTPDQKKLLYRHIGELAKQGVRWRDVQKAGGKETPKPKKRSIWSFLTRK